MRQGSRFNAAITALEESEFWIALLHHNVFKLKHLKVKRVDLWISLIGSPSGWVLITLRSWLIQKLNLEATRRVQTSSVEDGPLFCDVCNCTVYVQIYLQWCRCISTLAAFFIYLFIFKYWIYCILLCRFFLGLCSVFPTSFMETKCTEKRNLNCYWIAQEGGSTESWSCYWERNPHRCVCSLDCEDSVLRLRPLLLE